MPFEDELSEQLRRTGATFDLTARTAVVDGALARGQRSLRRRRGAAVAGSVLALALVGGGGAFGAGLLGGGPGGGTDVAGGGPVAATLTSAPDGASPAACHVLSLIHISEPPRLRAISDAVFFFTHKKIK
ncbi:hypothetical protein EF908_11800, partial [Streptomyces sp. WAC04770]